MAEITITIRTEPGESARDALIDALGLRGGGPTSQLTAGPEEPSADSASVDGAEWTPADLKTLWMHTRPEARKIWAEVAKRPEGYPFAEVEKVFGLDGNQIAGRMSSIGHARNRCFPNREVPVKRDYSASGRRYLMDANHAAVIRELAES
jgi:hypothetical protein